jgi:hypothetical protein
MNTVYVFLDQNLKCHRAQHCMYLCGYNVPYKDPPTVMSTSSSLLMSCEKEMSLPINILTYNKLLLQRLSWQQSQITISVGSI